MPAPTTTRSARSGRGVFVVTVSVMAPRIVGIVPAAGYATRLQPLDGSKEVYPVGRRPLMDYVVERMRAAPCDEVRVVTRPDKQDVIGHAAALGASVVEARPETLAESV